MREIKNLNNLNQEVNQLIEGFRNFYIQVEGNGGYWYNDYKSGEDDLSITIRRTFESGEKNIFKITIIEEFRSFREGKNLSELDTTSFFEEFYKKVLLNHLGLFYQQTELLNAYSSKKLKKIANEEYSLEQLQTLRNFLRDESNHLKSQMLTSEVQLLLAKELLKF